MFQSGLDVQQENAKAMQRLFDTFWQEGGQNGEPSGRAGSGKSEAGKAEAGKAGSR